MEAPTTLCSPLWLHKSCRICFLSSLPVSSSQRSLISSLQSFDLLVLAVDNCFALCTGFDMSLKMTGFSEAQVAIYYFSSEISISWINICCFASEKPSLSSHTLMKATFCCFWYEICGHMFSWNQHSTVFKVKSRCLQSWLPIKSTFHCFEVKSMYLSLHALMKSTFYCFLKL